MAKEALKTTKKIVAVDSGKYNMKLRSGDEVIIYENNFNEGTKETYGNTLKHTWNVEYNSKFYTIGASAEEKDPMEGKSSFPHFLGTLTGITNFLDPKKKDQLVTIIYGESMNFYKNPVHMSELKEQFNGRHKIKVNDKVYEFEVDTIHVLPEGIGHIICDEKSSKGVQYIVDIGGKTINFLKVRNSSIVMEESFSAPLGMNYLINLIIDIASNDGYELDPDLTAEYLEDGAPNTKVQKYIDTGISKQFGKLEKLLHVKSINLKHLTENHGVWFMGGGTLILRDKIVNRYGQKTQIPENPLTANVDGFYKFGVMVYGK